VADQLFDRRVRLTVAQPIIGEYKTAAPNAVEITDLRVRFRVDKNLGKEPNTAEITIYNLSADTRAKVQIKGARVVLEAGYASDGVRGIFVGDVRTAKSEHVGADWVTTLKCGDGERSIRHARVNESFAPGTGIADVARSLTRAMGVEPGNIDEAVKNLTRQHVHGYAVHGRAAVWFDRAITAAGLEWSIQDGRLQVLAKGEATKEPAVVLAADSGLIGSPEYNAAEKDKPATLTVKALLQPRIRPGGRIVLESNAHKGTFRVIKVGHAGDTAGGEWYTTAETDAK
jgi:hypothetical protein